MQLAIIDACALLNLLKSGGARQILAFARMEVWFQGLVEDEVISEAEQLAKLVEEGLLHQYPGSKIAATEVGEVAMDHGLGIGEAECLVICGSSDAILVSDDHRARRVGIDLLGDSRVTGTIGLLCHCVENGDITPAQAKALLMQAQNRGGYLPDFDFENGKRVA